MAAAAKIRSQLEIRTAEIKKELEEKTAALQAVQEKKEAVQKIVDEVRCMCFGGVKVVRTRKRVGI